MLGRMANVVFKMKVPLKDNLAHLVRISRCVHFLALDKMAIGTAAYMYCDRVGSAIAGCRALTSRSGAEAEKEPRL